MQTFEKLWRELADFIPPQHHVRCRAYLWGYHKHKSGNYPVTWPDQVIEIVEKFRDDVEAMALKLLKRGRPREINMILCHARDKIYKQTDAPPDVIDQAIRAVETISRGE